MRNLAILLLAISFVPLTGCPREHRGRQPLSLFVHNATDVPLEADSVVMRLDSESGQWVEGTRNWMKVSPRTKRGLGLSWIPKQSRAIPSDIKGVVARDASGREFFLSAKDFHEKACVEDNGLTWVVIIDKNFQPWRPKHCTPKCKACVPPQE